MPSLVDFHCHLDLYPDLEQIVEECEREAIYTLAVTTTPKAWKRNELVMRGKKYVRPAIGLHPQLVGERADEIALWEEILPATRYVGEVGLDSGPRFYQTIDAQKRVFERVLRACAAARDKVITIHSVRAVKPVLDMLEMHLPRGCGTPVLHWFTGTQAEARRAAELGCYFSINAAMLVDEKRSALVKSMPFDRLLTETDGPFTQSHGMPSHPRDSASAVLGLANLFGKEPIQVARGIMSNLKACLETPKNKA